MTLPVLTFTNLQVPHAVSTREGGQSKPPYASLNLAGRVGDDPQAVRHNREMFLAVIGHKPETAVGVRHVHGSRTVLATRADAGRGVTPEAAKAEEGDALITREPGIALIVLGADCTPILLWDPIRNVAGAVHAGWRGN